MNQSIQIDDVDRRLIRALQEDASLSQAALADKVGASPASCWRRMKALEQVGVLKGAVRLVDPVKVGRGVSVIVQIRLKSHAGDGRESFERFMRDHPEIIEGYSMSGEWDYLMRIAVADVADYERFLMRELLAHANVATTTSSFALSQVKYTTALPV